MAWEQLEKTVLITGASSGIGAATARRMATAGARVILVARRYDRIQALANELGNGAEAHAVDLRDRSAVEALTKRIDLPDVVANIAGIAHGREPLDETTIDDLDEVFDTNVKGVFYLTHQIIGPMRKRNSGHIIAVTSVAALYPYKGAGAYAPSKAAIHMFCKCLRNDLGGTRVRVSEIAPAMVQNTEFTSKRFNGDMDRVATTYKGLDVLRAEDIAEAILFAAAAPERVNVDLMEIFPVQQHQGPNVMNRDPG
jgi:NADP-dependent 3-hydroxy acid dehydrogenase YdfG